MENLQLPAHEPINKAPDFITRKVKPHVRRVQLKKVKQFSFKRMLRKIVFIITIITIVSGFAAYKIDQFFDHNSLQFRSPIQSPVLIVPRPTNEPAPHILPEAKAAAPEVKKEVWETITFTGDKAEVKRYICQKFGDDCRLALAVVHAENGTLDCERVGGPNTNGTYDRGLWQLNSAYHPFIKDCKANTDKAYEIYVSRGNSFDRWSAYNNGSYKKFLTINL